MGKWDEFKTKYKKFVGNDASYNQRVSTAKRDILEPSAEPSAEPHSGPLIASNTADNFRIEIQNTVGAIVYFLSHAAKARTVRVPGVVLRPELAAYAAGYRDARMLKETLERAAKQVGVYVQAYTELFEGQADADGMEGQLRLDDGSTYRTQGEPFLQVKDRTAFNAWCKANGYEPEMSLLWATANAIVKERLDNGEPEPPGTEIYWMTKMVHGKAKE